MADKDETMPVSSDQNTNMSLATNNTERIITEDHALHRRYEHIITAKQIPETKPKADEKKKEK